jgi:hypothetical protein
LYHHILVHNPIIDNEIGLYKLIKLTVDGLISFLLKNQVISGAGEPVTLHSICTLSPSVAV